MKEFITAIISVGVLVFCVLSFSGEVPDSFQHGGVYFDKIPKWMMFFFDIGVAATSMLSAFIAGAITYSILECKEIRIWIKERLQRYKNRSTYKFHDVANGFKRTIKY